MINLFLIISAIIGVVLILIILFQKTEGGSLGLGTQTSLTGGITANKSTLGTNNVAFSKYVRFVMKSVTTRLRILTSVSEII